MICGDCQAAAAHMRQGDTPERVAQLHAFCPGGTWCDCQHATGEHINRKEVERADLSRRTDARAS